MKLAPIILFVYNRPEHTLKTLKALKANNLASDSEIYVYCDGPKINSSSQDIINIQEVRRIVRKEKWCKKVHVIEHKTNVGLAKNITKGVSRLISEFGKVIVLEDDIVTSSMFLSYMNEALKAYEDEERVMHISGFFPQMESQLPNFFFYNQALCWGWATWERAWKHFNNDATQLKSELIKRNKVKKFNIDNSYPFLSHLEANITGDMITWAVKWHASVVLQNGLCLQPSKSYVRNIGFDNSGENSGVTKMYHIDSLSETPFVKPKSLKENKKARKAMFLFYSKHFSKKKSYKKLVKKNIKTLLPPELLVYLRRRFKKKTEFDALAELPRYTNAEVTLLGRKIKIVDSASFLFMHKEIFTTKVYNFEAKPKTPYIIDGGANIGLATIFFKQKYPNAEIVCFEPDKKVFDVLDYNIKNVFKYSGVQLINKGLWNKDETLFFDSEGADAGRILNTTNAKRVSHKITVTSLKPYLDKQVDFLKLDIEGAETTVLEDIKDKLVNVERIFVEYHSFVNKEQTLDVIISILKTASFRLYVNAPGLVNKSPFVSVNTYNSMDMQLNIYGIKTA